VDRADEVLVLLGRPNPDDETFIGCADDIVNPMSYASREAANASRWASDVLSCDGNRCRLSRSFA
jgi:hypothetical protein